MTFKQPKYCIFTQHVNAEYRCNLAAGIKTLACISQLCLILLYYLLEATWLRFASAQEDKEVQITLAVCRSDITVRGNKWTSYSGEHVRSGVRKNINVEWYTQITLFLTALGCFCEYGLKVYWIFYTFVVHISNSNYIHRSIFFSKFWLMKESRI